MTAIVIDAPVVLAALLDEDHAFRAEQNMSEDLVRAPRLLCLEVMNALVLAVPRKCLTVSDGAALDQTFEALTIASDDQLAEPSAIFDSSQTQGITTYDADYL